MASTPRTMYPPRRYLKELGLGLVARAPARGREDDIARPSAILIGVAAAGVVMLASAGVGAVRADAAELRGVYTLNRQSPVIRSDPANLVNVTLPSGTRGAYGIAARGQTLYWIQTRESTGGQARFSIARYRMRSGGLTPDLVKNIDQNTRNYPAVAAGADHIYWVEFDRENCAIGRAQFDGDRVNHRFIAGVSCQGGLAAWVSPSSSKGFTELFYVPSSNRGRNIARAAISDSYGGPGYVNIPDALVGASTEGVRGLGVSDNYLYWVDPGAFSSWIGRVPKDGPRGRTPTSNQAQYITGVGPYANGLAASEHWLYWTNPGNFEDWIGVRNLDTGTVVQNFIKLGGVGLGGVAIVKATCVPPRVVTDCDPPQTTITNAPNLRSATSLSRKDAKQKAKFTFTSDEPDSIFECRLDGGAFKWCGSPFRKRVKAAGKHRFEVRATDAGGNIDPTPAQRKFRLGT